MARGETILPKLLAVLMAAAGLVSCGSVTLTPPAEYSFSHALFNEPLPPALAVAQASAPEPTRKPEPTPEPARVTRPTSSEPIVVAAPELPEDPAAPPEAPPERRQRALMLSTATALVGMRDAFDGRGFLHHLLEAGDVRLSGIKSKPSIRDVYRALQSRRLTYDRNDPAPGDLAFFHNTEDQNKDGRQNDWYSLVGVVETVKPDGTITVILPSGGAVVRKVMNLRMPEVRRAESAGDIVNDVLRRKSLDDPPYTQYLAGELYAGFAAVP